MTASELAAPWRAEKPLERVLVILDSHNRVVCEVVRDNEVTNVDCKKANLLAALPDCIEALKGMLADVEAWQNNPHGQTPDGHVSKARRALKKAGCL